MVAVQELVDVQITAVAIPVANLNVVAAPKAKPLPLIVTLVPPAFVPLFGAIAVIATHTPLPVKPTHELTLGAA